MPNTLFTHAATGPSGSTLCGLPIKEAKGYWDVGVAPENACRECVSKRAEEIERQAAQAVAPPGKWLDENTVVVRVPITPGNAEALLGESVAALLDEAKDLPAGSVVRITKKSDGDGK